MRSLWDVFISHAREDKAAVAKPLAEALVRAGLQVSIDEHEISLGDGLANKINEELAQLADMALSFSVQTSSPKSGLGGSSRHCWPSSSSTESAFYLCSTILNSNPYCATSHSWATKSAWVPAAGIEGVASEVRRATGFGGIRRKLPSLPLRLPQRSEPYRTLCD